MTHAHSHHVLRPVAAVVVAAMPEEAAPFLTALPALEAAPVTDVPGGAECFSLRLGGRATGASRVDGGAGSAGTVDSAGSADGADGKDADQTRELLLVRSGIGMVAAASALATVLTQVRPEVVISAGTTGGLGAEVEVGDVCASTTLAYNDVDATAFGYALGQTPGQPAVFLGDNDLLGRLGDVGQEALRGATASSGSASLHRGQMLAGGSFITAATVAQARQAFPAAISTDMESTALAQVAASAGLPFASVRGVSDLCGPQAGQDFHIGADEAAARSAAVVLAVLG